MKFLLFHVLLLVVVFESSSATFTTDFRNFLKNRYGVAVEAELTREDLGAAGSFGGSLVGGKVKKQINFRPIIFVHGLTGTAGTMGNERQYFVSRGYQNVELYATTTGNGTSSRFTGTQFCEHIQQLRRLIVAVNEYTKSRVNIIGYSLGVTMARKAVMGGKCVEKNVNLGKPLTNLVDTFVGVAGANRGSMLCANTSDNANCNLVTGLHCNSTFLADINSKVGYEAKRAVYSIYSVDDDRVGYKTCPEQYITSRIPGETATFQLSGLNHFFMQSNTTELQFNLTTNSQL